MKPWRHIVKSDTKAWALLWLCDVTWTRLAPCHLSLEIQAMQCLLAVSGMNRLNLIKTSFCLSYYIYIYVYWTGEHDGIKLPNIHCIVIIKKCLCLCSPHFGFVLYWLNYVAVSFTWDISCFKACVDKIWGKETKLEKKQEEKRCLCWPYGWSEAKLLGLHILT